MHLYEIDGRIAQVIENGFAFDPETGEVFTGDELEELEASRDAKLEAVGLFIKDLAAEVEAFKAEEKALRARREAKEHRLDELKEYAAWSMTAHGQAKLDTPKVRLGFRKSSKTIIEDEESIPVKFKTTVETVKVDRAAIAKAIKAGETVSGARVETSQNLQVK